MILCDLTFKAQTKMAPKKSPPTLPPPVRCLCGSFDVVWYAESIDAPGYLLQCLRCAGYLCTNCKLRCQGRPVDRDDPARPGCNGFYCVQCYVGRSATQALGQMGDRGAEVAMLLKDPTIAHHASTTRR